MKIQDTPTVRASISFPRALYETLERLAKAKKVSLAWVVRDATERYVAEEAVGKPDSHSGHRRRQSVK